MKIITYPIKVKDQPNVSYDKRLLINRIKAAKSGSFLLGSNGWWHGGIHFKSKTDKEKDHSSTDKPETFNEAVQSIANGKIIAYRLNEDWHTIECTTTEKNGDKKTSTEDYSTSFVLIEHNLEHEYIRPVGCSQGDIIYNDCKFYTLYMHLAPINVLKKANKMLPWFLTSQRKDLVNKLKRGTVITLINPLDNKATENIDNATINALVAIMHQPTGVIYIPKRFIAKSKTINQYVISHPLDYYYEPYSNTVNTILEDTVFDRVIIPEMPIKVDAAEIIGYPGATILDNKKSGGMVHFEIFADNTDFMNNISEQNTPSGFFKNYSRYYHLYASRLEQKKSFASGEFYLKNQNSWDNYYHIDAKYANQLINYTLLDASNTALMTDGSSANITSVFTRPNIPYINALNICSDADWLEGPNSWQQKLANEFLTDNGQKDDSKTIPSNTENFAIKAVSEWSAQNLEIKYATIRNKIANYSQFIDMVQKHCFWQDVQAKVSSFPQSDEAWHFHPISFIERLQRIHTPFWDAQNPNTLFQYFDKHTNEALLLLRKREKELIDWLGSATIKDVNPQGTANKSLKLAFKLWFGFEELDANKKQLNSRTLLTVDVYDNSTNELLSLPVINTLTQAIIWVKDIIVRAIDLLETLGIENYVRAINLFCTSGAYVYSNDSQHHIHFAYQYLNGGDIKQLLSNTTQINITNLRILMHEISHFFDIGKMVDTNGSILGSGLYDLKVIINDSKEGKITYSPYGRRDCKFISQIYPTAALCNADNFSFFILHDKSLGDAYGLQHFDYF